MQKETSLIDEQKWQGKIVSEDVANFSTSIRNNMPDDLTHERSNEVSIDRVTGSVLGMQDAKRHFDPIVSTGSLSSEESVSSSVVNVM